MAKSKKYQIVISMADCAIIDSTNRKSEVEDWIKQFVDKNVPSSTLKVYQFEEVGYRLIQETAIPALMVNERLIGFGRW